ncbi:ABC transporter permease [Halostagnicola sp. A-GB9-2]|uniref:ABC transporter permease n=1 Tax=Halostagnicola sp. A-GB9-2 TaxID=3048066 RepID=UPI0024BFAE92|nr:ABC transporter permease [Halostagnicola sp. A-GB9-2]MDJ1433808.1 ABC transporter permease [Halostagnicola sp. A-GB9-2]
MATNEAQVEQDETAVSGQEVGLSHQLKQIKRDITARIGLYIVVLVTFVAGFSWFDANLGTITFGYVSDYTLAQAAPLLEHPERLPPPTDMNAHAPPAFVEGGTWEHPLGTDHEGRDYLSRIVYGTRISVMVGFAATAIGLVGGVAIGATAGYYGGRVDDLLMRFVEIIFAIPALVLIIVFTEFVSGGNPDIQYAVAGAGIASIPIFSRIMRSRVLSVREMEYIEAARSAGVKDRHIIIRHVIPNSFASVLVYATLQVGVVILLVASLSFLGYGAQPPTPDWGQMLSYAHGQMHSNPWMSVFPGLAILVTIMGFNLLGDGLQDALNPRIDN